MRPAHRPEVQVQVLKRMTPCLLIMIISKGKRQMENVRNTLTTIKQEGKTNGKETQFWSLILKFKIQNRYDYIYSKDTPMLDFGKHISNFKRVKLEVFLN